MGQLVALLLASQSAAPPFAPREATRNALARMEIQAGPAPTAADDRHWQEVIGLERGRQIVVQIEGEGSRRDCYLLRADRDGLDVLDVTEIRITAPEAEDLVMSATAYLESSRVDRPPVIMNDVRIDSSGITIWGVKRAETSRVIRRLARASVLEIRTPARIRGSKTATTLGVVGGAAAGYIFGVVHQEGGGSPAVAWAGLIAMPIAGGFLAHRATQHRESRVIYRR